MFDTYNIEIGNVTDVWYLQDRDRKCKWCLIPTI